MKQFKFNEQSLTEAMIKTNFIDKNNITNTIYSLAKYNYHVLHLKYKANYNRILKYITDNCPNIFEEAIYKDIDGCIKSAKKHSMVTIDEVCITQNELCTIRSLNDIKKEKVMFVLLATSKYFNLLSGNNYDSVFLNNADICKAAKVTIPVKDRDEFMQFAYDSGLLLRHSWSDSIIKKVTFVSHDENDKVILKLHENDFKDLANTYLAYLSPSKFRRCVTCGKWIRVNKQDRRLCRDCSNISNAQVEKDFFRTVICPDCGKVLYVPILDTKTCRCEDCQKTRDEELNRIASRERMRRYRSSL